MTTKKHIGVWMDHSVAHLIELADNVFITNTISSEFTHAEKEHSLSKSENLMHHKEQHQQSHYYKRLSETLKGYEEIVLFGPTTAKSELWNLLKADHHFDKVKIEVKQADKMSPNQQQAFVREHFHFKLIS